MNVLHQDIRYLKGVGEKRAELYKKLGVSSICDLLHFYPRTYIDYSSPVPFLQAPAGELCCVRGTVYKKAPPAMIRKNMILYKVFVTDGETEMTVTIFNNKFGFEALKVDEEYLFYGKISGNFTGREMNSPLFIPAGSSAKISPVYHLTSNISSKVIAGHVASALSLLGDAKDPLPDELRKVHRLCGLSYALHNIHFPSSKDACDAAKRRLIFEELFTLQLGLFLLKNRRKTREATSLKNVDLTPFLSSLPFSLTGAQHRAISEAVGDMQKNTPMNRLVQGDVGSGKTAIAAALIYLCTKNGLQSALMAPTEILAQQHYETLGPLLGKLGVRTVLLTGSTAKKLRADILADMMKGGVDLVIGTHALLEEDVAFRNLGLAVTDEQHRFGVEQRSRLTAKGTSPHCLVMSATPIPRTLALILYGDLDISIVDELPPGRRPVKTYCVGSSKRGDLYGFVKKQLDEGRQAYIVCPLIEGEDESKAESAVRYAKSLLRTPLKDYPTAVVHGKMPSAQKEQTVRLFANGEIKILVSTTVIEVGVNVPNASFMIIENAERFGLSQLHQLRGRIGRSSHQSYCVLISDAQAAETKRRLDTLCSTTDGFKISEYDLQLRGPGNFFGRQQHGLPDLKIADMLSDVKLLAEAQRAASAIIADDPQLSNPLHTGLQGMVDDLFHSSQDISFN